MKKNIVLIGEAFLELEPFEHESHASGMKMIENESFESQTDTEGSTDNEDIAEQPSVVQPYQFEPVADSDYEEDRFTLYRTRVITKYTRHQNMP